MGAIFCEMLGGINLLVFLFIIKFSYKKINILFIIFCQNKKGGGVSSQVSLKST